MSTYIYTRLCFVDPASNAFRLLGYFHCLNVALGMTQAALVLMAVFWHPEYSQKACWSAACNPSSDRLVEQCPQFEVEHKQNKEYTYIHIYIYTCFIYKKCIYIYVWMCTSEQVEKAVSPFLHPAFIYIWPWSLGLWSTKCYKIEHHSMQVEGPAMLCASARWHCNGSRHRSGATFPNNDNSNNKNSELG